VKAAVLLAPHAIPDYADFDEPRLTPDRELVELVAAGLHPIVRSLAAGRHYGSTATWPQVPGVDAVARTRDGQLIYTGYVEAPYGTLAERMAVPARMRSPLPANADPVRVAGGLNPGLSSWMPLHARAAQVAALGTVLVLGVTGMAGLLAVQNALALGAERVVGAGRDPMRLEQAAAYGATTVTLTGDRDGDAAAIASALGDTAPSLVLDYLWGMPAEATFGALGRHGLDADTADIAYVQIGAMAGPNAAVPAALLRSRRIRISGTGAGSASVQDITAQLPGYMQLIADRRVDVPTVVYPLSRVAEAWIAAADRGPRVVAVPD
jgi:NADPH:quinone reductase-like Zn-dependent oxidoreductase